MREEPRTQSKRQQTIELGAMGRGALQRLPHKVLPAFLPGIRDLLQPEPLAGADNLLGLVHALLLLCRKERERKKKNKG